MSLIKENLMAKLPLFFKYFNAVKYQMALPFIFYLKIFSMLLLVKKELMTVVSKTFGAQNIGVILKEIELKYF